MPPMFHYQKGKFIPYRSNDWKRRFHRLIVIEDSGDVGSDSEFYVLAATVTDDMKRFENTTHAFPRSRRENKHNNLDDADIAKVLTRAEDCIIDIYAISYGKSGLNLESPKNKKEHNIKHTLELVELVIKEDNGAVYDVMMDNTSLMDGYKERFVEACLEIAGYYGKRIENIEMRDSSGTKILQVQDFITGAIWAHIEYEKDAENSCHDRFGIIGHKVKEIVRK
jgi:hypothetical protein